MIKKIKKAVFPVAGLGTRFLPATKAMPKELLPIVDKPLIQYAAEEAIEAGIDTLIFVTGRNKRAIEDHFDSNFELQAMLRAKGENVKADMVHNIIPEGVECIFVRQPQQLGLGDAILRAERAVGKEPFAVLLADDFLVPQTPGVTEDLLRSYNQTGKSQISVTRISVEKSSEYGIVVPNKDGSGIVGLVEKPEPKDSPSNLASIGRYVFDQTIFDILRELDPGHGGEIQLADAIDRLAKLNCIQTLPMRGKRFDCGSVDGYLSAINFICNTKANA